MHHHSCNDTYLRLFNCPSYPEVVYRSRGPPLSALHCQKLLNRSKNVISQMEKGNPSYNIVNNLVPCNFGSESNEIYQGFVQSCGIHQNDLELVSVGGQFEKIYNEVESLNPLDSSIDFTSFEQCFRDIFEAEYYAYKYPISRDHFDYDSISSSFGQTRIPKSSFGFKRLALMKLHSFGSERLCEIRVDDKHYNRPIVYARNKNGFCIIHLNVDSLSNDDSFYSQHTMNRNSKYFPSVSSKVLVDTTTMPNERLVCLMVNPHEYGMMATVTRQHQFLIWDSFRSMPVYKYNLLKSTDYHQSHCETYNKYYGSFSSEILECGCFTDRRDCVLLCGSKVYLVDCRDRSIGSIFPREGMRPPSSYRYPGMDSRLPISDRIIAIERHPSYPSLYALSSSVSSSILLWDIRSPHQILDEIPLPLVRQGRGRYRHISWHPVPDHIHPPNETNLFFLSSFCWEYGYVMTNLLSINDSSDIRINSLKRKHVFQSNLPLDNLSEHISPFCKSHHNLTLSKNSILYSNSSHDTEDSNLIFSDIFSTQLSEKVSSNPFFVNPFVLFHQSSQFNKPCGDGLGLCFSSSRPPYQIVVHHQKHIPMGTSSLSSEIRYFSPLGPFITHYSTLINEGLHSPLAEAPLSQLFHGIGGFTLVNLKIPTNDGYMIESVVALSLLFSGRMLATCLNVKCENRKLIMDSTNDTPKKASIMDHLIELYELPKSQRSKNKNSLFPFLPLMDNMLQGTSTTSQETCDKDHLNDSKSLYESVISSDYLRLLETHDIDSFQYTFFPYHLDQQIEKKKLRGLHELLKPNDDSLYYITFTMDKKVNFLRQRLETLILWQYPSLNPIYFPEALINLLLNNTLLTEKKNSAPISCPVIIPNSKIENSLDANESSLKSSSDCQSVTELIMEMISSQKRFVFTLKEVFDFCSSDKIRSSIRQKINSDIEQASSQGLDSKNSEYLPLTNDLAKQFNGVFIGFSNNVATPICSCFIFNSKSPMTFQINSNISENQLLLCLTPPNVLINNSSVARFLYNYLHNYSVLSDINSLTNNLNMSFGDLSIMEKIANNIVNNGLGLFISKDWFIKNPIESKMDSCDVKDINNPFCILASMEAINFHYDVARNNNGTETETPLIQGGLYLPLDTQSLKSLSEAQRNSILENTQPEYPAFYAFLSGIRITVDLHDYLKREWCHWFNENSIELKKKKEIKYNLDSLRLNTQFNFSSKYQLSKTLCASHIDQSLDDQVKNNNELLELLELSQDRPRSSHFFLNSDLQGSQHSSLLSRLSSSSQLFSKTRNSTL